jgi:hypothetical protein
MTDCAQPASQSWYPPYVSTESDRRRWDLCAAIATDLFGGVTGSSADVWAATRALYRSDIPT